MNRKAFFAAVRVAPFGRTLTTTQTRGITAVLDEWERRCLRDIRQLAYMLATDFHETARTMQAIEEYGKGKGRKYGKPVNGHVYYGRGLVQLTWDYNYDAMGKVLGIDLLNNPKLALDLAIAVQIMFEGMVRGTFTGKKLSHFFSGSKCDWRNARKIINGLDKADLIAGHAKAFYQALLNAAEPKSDHEPEPAPAPEPARPREEPVEQAEPPTPEPAPKPETSQPPANEVENVQRRLRELGYFAVGVPDGDMAASTRGAIVAFKHDNGLTPETPEIDQAFLAALATAKPRRVSEARANTTETQLAKKNETIWSLAWDKVVKIVSGIVAACAGFASYVGEKFRDTWEWLGDFRDILSGVPLWVWLSAAAAVLIASYELSRRAGKDTLGKYKTGELN